jgi:phosphatidylethanolamine/phosphatidyl-N-methylethanolamine N-methyltransferase
MSTTPKPRENDVFMFRQFFRDHGIASVKSTSAYLVRRICRRIDRTRPRVIVELGPGAGCFTRVLLERLSPDSTLVLIEANPEFAAELGKVRDPRLRVIQGNAQNLREILARDGISEVDLVLSGIPFSYYPDVAQVKLLTDIHSVLAPGGVFVAYQATARLEKPLKRVFVRVRVEWQLFHIPPLVVFEARAA